MAAHLGSGPQAKHGTSVAFSLRNQIQSARLPMKSILLLAPKWEAVGSRNSCEEKTMLESATASSSCFNRPFMVMFETTLHCNMKCGYCAIWQEPAARRPRRARNASSPGWMKRLRSGSLPGASPGEPLMNPNMPDYIGMLRAKASTLQCRQRLALKRYAEACVKLESVGSLH